MQKNLQLHQYSLSATVEAHPPLKNELTLIHSVHWVDIIPLAVGKMRIAALISYSLQVLFIGDAAETASLCFPLHSRMLRSLPWRGFMITDDSVICIDDCCR